MVKESFDDYVQTNHFDAFEVFNDDLTLDRVISKKLASVYYDGQTKIIEKDGRKKKVPDYTAPARCEKVTDYLGNTEIIEITTFHALFAIEFCIKDISEYMYLCQMIQQEKALPAKYRQYEKYFKEWSVKQCNPINTMIQTPLLTMPKKSIALPLALQAVKGNGKTYGIILKYLKRRFADAQPKVLRYLRRFKESISPKAIQSLCKPHRQSLINLSGGKYNDFQYFQNRFWFIRRDDSGKIVEKDRQPFIICSALNSVEASTGADEGECYAVFMTRCCQEKKFCPMNFMLMIFHNNCIRNRTDYYCPLILVGNTVQEIVF